MKKYCENSYTHKLIITLWITLMKEGGWRPKIDRNTGLIGKKVGIVGYGAIAKYYVDLLKWFNVDLYVYSKYITDEEIERIGAKRATLEEIFSTCDVISLHSALNEENRGMITGELLAMIKDGALFVNTARGRLVDDEALIKELGKGRFNAAIDVFVTEPLEKESPYRKMNNVMLFPHIAGPTFDMRERVLFELLEDILRINRGEDPKNYIPYDYAIRMTV